MQLDEQRIRHAPAGAFARELRRRVDAHFEANGRKRRGDSRQYRKAAAITLWWTASYAAALALADGLVTGALAVLSLSLASAAVPMGIAHDGAHRAFSDRPWLNSAAAWCVNLLGISTPWWRLKHGALHHGFTRIHGLDDDLDQGALFRMHPEQPRRAVHRWQHLYAPLLYPFLHVAMVVTGLRFLLTGCVGRHRFRPPSRRDRALGVGLTAAGFGLLLGLPCLVHPPAVVAAGLATWSAGFGLVLVLIFQVEHCVGEVRSPELDRATGEIRHDWAASQVRATQNFAPDSRWLTWFSGGLNFHVEHHLFPRVGHVHYRDLSPIVSRTCRKHGLPYRSVPTFREALAAHFRWLRRLGREELAPARHERGPRPRPRHGAAEEARPASARA